MEHRHSAHRVYAQLLKLSLLVRYEGIPWVRKICLTWQIVSDLSEVLGKLIIRTMRRDGYCQPYSYQEKDAQCNSMCESQ